MRNILRVLAIILVLILLSTIIFVIFDFNRSRTSFPYKTFIGKADVSYLTSSEALAKIELLSLEELFTPTLTFEATGISVALTPTALGLHVLPGESVQKAFELTHQPAYWQILFARLTKKSLACPLYMAIDEKSLKEAFSQLEKRINSSPKDAAVSYVEETGGYHIAPEVIGRTMDIDKSLVNFRGALQKGETIIPLVAQYVSPRILEKTLRAHPPAYRLSAYTTYYGKHDSPNRIHNIKLIASWIDGTILLPGDTYSAAKVIGKVTPERGFKEAFVIIGGALEPSLGGGACQTATTLYNAVMLADLKVLERRNHSFYFNIYPLGRDAGVYPGQLDFRFQNDTGYPMVIKATATNQKLSFRIYGTPTQKVVTFSSPAILGRSSGGRMVPMSLWQVIRNDCAFQTTVIRTVSTSAEGKVKEEVIRSYYKLYGEKSNVPIRRPEPR